MELKPELDKFLSVSLISLNDCAAAVAGSNCDFAAVEASCSALFICAVNSLKATGSFNAFSIEDASIFNSFLPVSLSCLFTLDNAFVIAPLATSVSFVQAIPKAFRSSSNSPLFLLNLPRASPMFLADEAALSIDVKTSMDLESFNFLSSSAIPAFSSKVIFVFFFEFKSLSLSERVLLDASIASN